jgi:hypothetical protein
MSMKKKAVKSKSSVAIKGKQVARPASKKPRPKKHVEAKMPKLGVVPEAIDAPKEVKYEDMARVSQLEALSKSKNVTPGDVHVAAKIPTGGVSIRPELGELKDRYADLKKISTSASTTPRLTPPGEVIQVELPYGQTEESLSRLIYVAVDELKNNHKAQLAKVANVFGEEYKSKGFDKMPPQDKVTAANDLPTVLAYDTATATWAIGTVEKLKEGESPLAKDKQAVETEKLGLFARFRNWLNS